MAELLVYDRADLNRQKHGEGHHLGDVILVRPDGYSWEGEMGPPKFAIVKLPGVSLARAASLCERDERTDVKRIRMLEQYKGFLTEDVRVVTDKERGFREPITTYVERER